MSIWRKTTNLLMIFYKLGKNTDNFPHLAVVGDTYSGGREKLQQGKMCTNTNSKCKGTNLFSKEFTNSSSNCKTDQRNPSSKLNSIYTQLTGLQFSGCSKLEQFQDALTKIDECLALEKLKSRLARVDYDANRHIAIHQLRQQLLAHIKMG